MGYARDKVFGLPSHTRIFVVRNGPGVLQRVSICTVTVEEVSAVTNDLTAPRSSARWELYFFLSRYQEELCELWDAKP